MSSSGSRVLDGASRRSVAGEGGPAPVVPDPAVGVNGTPEPKDPRPIDLSVRDARIRVCRAGARVALARELHNEALFEQATADQSAAWSVLRSLVMVQEGALCRCSHIRAAHVHGATGVVGCTECGCDEFGEPSDG